MTRTILETYLHLSEGSRQRLRQFRHFVTPFVTNERTQKRARLSWCQITEDAVEDHLGNEKLVGAAPINNI
jgi:hypothetical protein